MDKTPLPGVTKSKGAARRESLAQLDAALGGKTIPLSAGAGVIAHMSERAREALDPRNSFLRIDEISKRPMHILNGFVCSQTKEGKRWRQVDIWDTTETHPKNSPRRELALLAHPEEPMYGDEHITGQFYEMLLDWASDTEKRDFLKEIRHRFMVLKNADSRRPTNELESLAVGVWQECREYLRITPAMEHAMLKHSGGNTPKYKNYPNFCKMRVVFVMSHMINFDLKRK